jgi:predicted O-methyltransferase YrrM
VYSRFQLFQKYLRYYLSASNSKGHGIHSPFVFDFVTRVLNDRKVPDNSFAVEGLRLQLSKSSQVIEVEDFGAGSGLSGLHNRSVAEITRRAAKTKKYGQLLFRICRHYHPRIMLELGTSLGLSSAYLASSDPSSKLITIEGASAVAMLAKKNFEALELRNIELVTGNFDVVLDSVMAQLPSVDLVFIDGNHRKEPVLAYFRQILEKVNPYSLLIFDDIHWSSEMEECWELVKTHPQVMVTVDLFFMGIVFFREEFRTKQHFTIRF